ncbi:hypothetical protein [Dyella mobilis]|uniref:Nicotinamide riboside transporter PnuC n=1 Tax=Dyella mobilis TaxID=1849582 RepID=A0ABS2KL22_9GAMM|nr:hypothetical protein [Dyella mobilis]MBM7131859.1 hypothetical protein [Dyella mobilis]GLQ96159.1 hypothetical protein GCM10007863_05770 [Dyella mobilis]
MSILSLAGMIVFTALYYSKLGWVSVAKYWLGWIAGSALFYYVFNLPIAATTYSWAFVVYAIWSAQ